MQCLTGAADACLGQFREAHQEMTLAPRIVRPPSGAAWFAARARVEDMAGGEVAVRRLRRRQLCRVALLTAQPAELAKETAPLRVRAGRRHGEQRDECDDGASSR